MKNQLFKLNILSSTILIFLISIFGISCSNKENETNLVSKYLSPDVLCGTVQFTDGCSPQLDSLISFGFALIHHMTYDDAEYTFDRVIELDKDCFWGHWGKAMTYIHPVWPDVFSEKRIRKGWALSQTALSLAKNEKEKLYGSALATFYDGQDKTKRERLLDYGNAWHHVHKQLPEDLEAQLFYALTMLANVSPEDKSYDVQREAGALAENTLETIPDHPGGFHYAIHAYDSPPLAEQALKVARQYNEIAPEIPHALHMPTHIFTRLGQWQESIDLNLRSAAAAKKFPVNGDISLHYFHALDYLTYSYLQQSDYENAKEIISEVNKLSGTFQNSPATAYALAAIRGRVALEYQQWDEAAKLSLKDQSNFQLEKFPQFEALIYYAQGIGAARSGDNVIAGNAYNKLNEIHEKLNNSKTNAYWANQIDIQKTVVNAWATLTLGNKDKALELMMTAADMEDASEKNPVTPGQLLPVREMLGDLHIELGNPNEALQQYEKTLVNCPNRFNSIYGAGKSAEMMGDKRKARNYYSTLLKISGDDNLSRDRLLHASNMVNGI